MYTEFERVVSVLVVGRGPPHCKSRHYLSVPTLLPRLVSFAKGFLCLWTPSLCGAGTPD